MKLMKFRVQKFRSIMDSTWIDCNDVTNIIGVNEAGKSNILLALWKLHPTIGGEINLLEDLPRSLFSDLKDSCGEIFFIETYFYLDNDSDLLKELLSLTNATPEELNTIYIARRYDGKYHYDFPNEKKISALNSSDLKDIIEKHLSIIKQIEPSSSTERKYKENVVDLILPILSKLNLLNEISLEVLQSFLDNCTPTVNPTSKSTIKPIFEEIITEINNCISKLNKPPLKSDDVWKALYSALPHFVYYSNYGNLDSEIYLPHIIENLKRTDISGVAAAKTRTLQVLFDFINLNPVEILELGDDRPRDQNGQVLADPTEEQLSDVAKKKEERTVLLNSASSKLTREFKNWWKQGNYIFDLRADGKFFKIWVSDDKRPDRVALESRSTGLQWFLSFYLIFLMGTKKHLKNSIILLDEAGLSLHPLAQKDLLSFFKNLSSNNQIIHTTHSPFLVDTDNIDNVKIAYVDNDGYTVASNNLRANTDPKHDTSVYAVHAALGLSVSDILLQGCNPIIVEGPSDQYYLNTIKTWLIASGQYLPKKELVFIPSGGVKGIPAIASIVSVNGELPFVIIDSDSSGRNFKAKLLSDLYKEIPGKIIEIADITKMENSEVEDIIPFTCLSKSINKIFRDVDDNDFEDIFDSAKPLLPQLESFATENSVSMQKGFKVDIAKASKSKLLKLPTTHEKAYQWVALFKKLDV